MPTSPTVANPSPPVVSTPPAPSYTVLGTVVATNGGFRIPNITIRFANLASEQFSPDGSFRVSFNSPGTRRIEVSGPTIVSRAVWAVLTTPMTELTIDAFSLSGGFDLAFYRQFTRNTLSGVSLPLRHQAQPPRIYLRTIDETGTPIDALTLNGTQAAIESVTGLLTGAFGIAGLERGTSTREGQPGWITVRWMADQLPDQRICGRAAVGGTLMELYPRALGCRCGGGPAIAPSIIKHEMGHALGFWHTDSPNDLMYGGGQTYCDTNPSAREQFHAALAYRRPNGNMDPDIDP